jgi:hypothetical protein
VEIKALVLRQLDNWERILLGSRDEKEGIGTSKIGPMKSKAHNKYAIKGENI